MIVHGREVTERCRPDAADQTVQPPERLDGGFDQVLHSGVGRQIRNYPDRRATRCSNRLGCIGDCAAITCSDGDRGTFSRDLDSSRPADTDPGTRHGHHPAAEPEIHAYTPSFRILAALPPTRFISRNNSALPPPTAYWRMDADDLEAGFAECLLPHGTPHQVADQMARLAGVGVTRFYVQSIGSWDESLMAESFEILGA